jgi:hypothetical protein
MWQTIPNPKLDRSHIAPVKTCEELIYLLSRAADPARSATPSTAGKPATRSTRHAHPRSRSPKTARIE